MIEKFKKKGYVEAYTILGENVKKVLTDFKKSKKHTNYAEPHNYYVHVVFIENSRPYSSYHKIRIVFKTKKDALKWIIENES